jgi:outer membrane protein OmpA-like peptidoglycan-associated protein
MDISLRHKTAFLFCFELRYFSVWALTMLFAVWSSPLPGQELRDVEKLNNTVNTDEYDEASPVISLDGNSLYFTRTGSPEFIRTLVVDGEDISATLKESEYRKILSDIYSQLAGKPIRDPYLSPYNQDIYIALSSNGKIDSVIHPGEPLNNAFPNSVMSGSADTGTLVVINQFYESGSMYEGFSTVDVDSSGSFSFPRPLHIYDFYNRSDNVNLAMNRHGMIMILSLEQDDSFGKNDLYISFKIKDDLWSAPVNIGGDLNTPFQESTPFITQDGRNLYFASDRPGTAGGMDIWVSHRLDYTWKQWSKPERLMEPVNSEFDDAQACIDDHGSFIYFASRRDGTSDIFRLPLEPKPKLSKPLTIKGRIVDGDSGEAIRAELYYGPESIEQYLEYFHTHTGIFNAELQNYEVYKFFARKAGYQPTNLKYDARLADMQDLSEHYMVLKLYKIHSTDPPTEKIVIDSSITLAQRIATLPIGEKTPFHNLYFEKTKAIVLEKSFPALDELVMGLEENPSLKIQIEGHTDNIGNDKDLMELSWQRAEAIKAYLVEKGINESRISTVGYGSQRPVSDNFSEENRSKNRRVEVRLTGK